jgi:hypothetical protein
MNNYNRAGEGFRLARFVSDMRIGLWAQPF